MPQLKALIVEDDQPLREALSETVALAGIENTTVDCAEQAVKLLSQGDNNQYGIIVSDINLAKMDGHALLAHCKRLYPDLPVILMTAYGDISRAVKAMQAGAVDYLLKPFAAEALVAKVQQYMRQPIQNVITPCVACDQSLELLNLAKRVANTDATIMITGPSGTGKEVLARYIHEHSTRKDAPFIAINCAAIPDNMLESTLFGYEKGAFTGAYQACPGKFEQAQSGTILLDEVSEMALSLQAKLLRVLQEKEVERLGGKKTVSLDVRVMATSNRELLSEVKAGRFREDLYYRLNVFPLHWLPLYERADDILPIAKHMLERYSQMSHRALPTLSDEAQALLLKYEWPGNVRELGNVLQRALILQPGDVIELEDIHLHTQNKPKTKMVKENKVAAENLGDDLKNREYELILKSLAENDGNRQQVAKQLGISPRTLRYKLAKMRELGLSV